MGRPSDLGGFFANIDAKTGENLHTNTVSNAAIEIDHMDMSESMQEAMHLSNMEMRYIWSFTSTLHIISLYTGTCILMFMTISDHSQSIIWTPFSGA